MNVKEAIEKAIEEAEYGRSLPQTPHKVIGYALTHGNRWSGGHGTRYEGRNYNIINIRNADGTPRNQYVSLLNYKDGELIADLIEQPQDQPDPDNIIKLIAMAYQMGQETATRKICDIHNQRIAKARDATKSYRYWRLANDVLNNMGGDMIYDPAYANDMTSTFGDDPINYPTH